MTLAFLEKNWMLVLTLVASGAMLVWPLLSRRLSGARDIDTLRATQMMNAGNPLLRTPATHDHGVRASE